MEGWIGIAKSTLALSLGVAIGLTQGQWLPMVANDLMDWWLSSVVQLIFWGFHISKKVCPALSQFHVLRWGRHEGPGHDIYYCAHLAFRDYTSCSTVQVVYIFLFLEGVKEI